MDTELESMESMEPITVVVGRERFLELVNSREFDTSPDNLGIQKGSVISYELDHNDKESVVTMDGEGIRVPAILAMVSSHPTRHVEGLKSGYVAFQVHILAGRFTDGFVESYVRPGIAEYWRAVENMPDDDSLEIEQQAEELHSSLNNPHTLH